MNINYQPTNKISEYINVSNSSLLKYYMNFFSECGQDGILNEIFNRINLKNGFFCEFGAWDGYYLSNCRRLNIVGWKGIFIEADPAKFEDLKKNDDSGLNYFANEYVSNSNNHKNGMLLQDILKKHQIDPSKIDFLSIDIDGIDLEVFESINFRPKVVLLEGGFNYNPTLNNPLDIDYASNNNQHPLQYIRDRVNLLGYEIICFFQDSYLIRNDLVEKFNDCASLSTKQLYLDAWHFANSNLKDMIRNIRANDKVIQTHELMILNKFSVNPV